VAALPVGFNVEDSIVIGLVIVIRGKALSAIMTR